MSTMNCESTVNELQNLAKEWASLFDVKPPLDLLFHINANNLLAVNGIVLGPASEIDTEASVYDVEYLHIYTSNGSYYEIYLDWTNDNRCQIGYIQHVTTIYCVDPSGSAE